MLDCIRQDYVRTARGKVQRKRVIFRDALKNALLPITFTGGCFASLISGAVVVGIAIPGLGNKIVDSISPRYPDVAGIYHGVGGIFHCRSAGYRPVLC